jgi:hypothetical protein
MRKSKRAVPSEPEQAAGNGLLDRRLFLTGSDAFEMWPVMADAGPGLRDSRLRLADVKQMFLQMTADIAVTAGAWAPPDLLASAGVADARH